MVLLSKGKVQYTSVSVIVYSMNNGRVCPLFLHSFKETCLITLAYFISMLSRGSRTFSSFRNPLSTSLKPNLGPISPTTIPKREQEQNKVSQRQRWMRTDFTTTPDPERRWLPGSGMCVLMSRMGTMKAWIPWQFPRVWSWARTIAWFEVLPTGKRQRVRGLKPVCSECHKVFLSWKKTIINHYETLREREINIPYAVRNSDNMPFKAGKWLLVESCRDMQVSKYLRPPGHHLIELIVGLFNTNSCVAGSYVAVVSSPRRCVPRETKHQTPPSTHIQSAQLKSNN